MIHGAVPSYYVVAVRLYFTGRASTSDCKLRCALDGMTKATEQPRPSALTDISYTESMDVADRSVTTLLRIDRSPCPARLAGLAFDALHTIDIRSERSAYALITR